MNRKKSIIYTASIIAIFAVVFTCLFSLKGCFSKTLSRTFFAADTVCTITLYDGSESDLDGAVDIVFSLADKFNCRDENSELGILNKTKSCKNPSSELKEIIEQGMLFSSLGKGSFDITVKPLSSLWDFKNEVIPKNADISAVLPKIGYKNIEISDSYITLKNGAEIDLGGIAKGYMADKITDFLIRNGVKSAVINLGGNVSVIGKKQNKNFTVGIQKPFGEGNSALISCYDMSVVTSGIYQRYFEKNGKIHHHLLNTKTGYPEQNGLYSVTIISKFATVADALSTLCFLEGLEKGMELIEKQEGIEAVFIDKNQKMHLSSGLTLNGNLIEIK